MRLEFAEITDGDLEKIKETASKPIKLVDISSHDFFGRPINLIKLTTVLAILGEKEKIASIAGAVSSWPELRDPSALEILLTSKNESWKVQQDISKDLQTSLRLHSGSHTVDKDDIRSISVFCKLQLLKHAALQKKWQVIRLVRESCSDVEHRFLEEFLVSLARFSALFLDRLRANADHDAWIEYCKMIAAHYCNKGSSQASLLNSCLALLMANKGDLEGAEKIAAANKKGDKHLKASISMRRAIKIADYEAAIGFADQIIALSSPISLSSDFSPAMAEFALRRVNKLLLDADLKPFLISGTLLGCMREGRIFSHDKDFDLGMFGWESQYDVAAALLKSGEFAFSVKDLRGSKLFLLPVRHVPSGFDFDIFFFHDRGDHFLHGIDSRLGYTINFRFSKFNLVSKSFLGDDFYIPDNFKLMLSENYGDGWEKPDPFYFVKLQSPALVRDNAALMGFVARHEMLDLINKRGSLEKAYALIECVKLNVPKKFHPSQRVIDKFICAVDGSAI